MKENGSASDKPLDNVILNRMRGFAGMNKLKKEALKVIATGMSPEEIAGLKALFVVRYPPPPRGPREPLGDCHRYVVQGDCRPEAPVYTPPPLPPLLGGGKVHLY